MWNTVKLKTFLYWWNDFKYDFLIKVQIKEGCRYMSSKVLLYIIPSVLRRFWCKRLFYTLKEESLAASVWENLTLRSLPVPLWGTSRLEWRFTFYLGLAPTLFTSEKCLVDSESSPASPPRGWWGNNETEFSFSAELLLLPTPDESLGGGMRFLFLKERHGCLLVLRPRADVCLLRLDGLLMWLQSG